jgi:hypothetical protein
LPAVVLEERPGPELSVASSRPRSEASIVSAKIFVVNVERLGRMVRESTVHGVLMELMRLGSSLVDEVEASACRFALISYRQVRAEPDDGTTLDADAIHSIVACAEAGGHEGVWLDGWCVAALKKGYTGEYNHDEFCKTLAAVTTHMAEVVWLPRARPDASSSYPFRLWCVRGCEHVCVGVPSDVRL